MSPLEQVCAEVKAASRVLAGLPGRQRDAALAEMAEALERRCAEILRTRVPLGVVAVVYEATPT